MNKYMRSAIEEARKGIDADEGGPFGSVIVKDGEIVGRGHNQVVLFKDPTCHGEVQAIRNACQSLSSYDLSGCTIYTTGEPCPMCLAACMWANIDLVYYGCTINDNAEIGFRDARFDELLGGRERMKGYLKSVDREACLRLFEDYKNKKDHTRY